MGAAGHLAQLQAAHSQRDLTIRPFFIMADRWAVFTAFVRDEVPLTEIAASAGMPVRRTRQIVDEVHAQLSLPRYSEREWREITPNSPVDDLNLSVRTLHKVRQLKCSTVEDVLRLDLKRISGRGSRTELIDTLRACGFRSAAGDTDGPDGDLSRVSTELREISNRIESDLKGWRQRLHWIESRLKRIASKSV